MGGDGEKLRFNLDYQDSRVKTRVEELCGLSRLLPSRDETTTACFELITAALTIPLRDGDFLWQKMNDNDLDALVFSVLEGCDPNRQLNLLREGCHTNQLALDGLPSRDLLISWPLERIIEYQVFAGTVWWPKRGGAWDRSFDRKRVFGIDHRGSFVKEIRRSRCNLVFFSDDNGELAWDLLLSRVLLEIFPSLRITFVTNTIPVGNNANAVTLQYCLNHPQLEELRRQNRFRLFLEENARSSLEPFLFSKKLSTRMARSDLAFLKGVGLFETAQRLPLPAFYGFVIHSKDSELITGLPKCSGVFVRIPENSVAYSFRKKTLLNFLADSRFES
jgi:hypothetical protein